MGLRRGMKPFKLEDLPENVRKQVEDSLAVQAADNKQNPVYEAAGKDEIEKVNPPVIISYHERRKRLRDSDNCFSKWVTDSIVERGILPDDDPSIVKKVIYSQEKCGKGEEEQTEIWIETVLT